MFLLFFVNDFVKKNNTKSLRIVSQVFSSLLITFHEGQRSVTAHLALDTFIDFCVMETWARISHTRSIAPGDIPLSSLRPTAQVSITCLGTTMPLTFDQR